MQDAAKETDWYLCHNCQSHQVGVSVLLPVNFHADGRPTVSREDLTRVNADGHIYFYCAGCDQLFSRPNLEAAPGGLH